MKKVFISLFLMLSPLSPVLPCGQGFVIKKVSCILNNIIRRIEKDRFDFSEQEVRNAIDLFHYEYKAACLRCREDAELRYLHLIHILSVHIKNYKNL